MRSIWMVFGMQNSNMRTNAHEDLLVSNEPFSISGNIALSYYGNIMSQ